MTLPARPFAVHDRPQLFTVGDGHYILDAHRQQIEAAQVRRDRNGELRCILDESQDQVP